MKYICLVVGLLWASLSWSSVSAQIFQTIDFCPIYPEGEFSVGEIIEIPILVEDFTDISSVRFGLVYDADQLQLVGSSVNPAFVEAFSPVDISAFFPGLVSVVWMNQSLIFFDGIADGEQFFTLRFRILEPTSNPLISFSNSPTPIQVVSRHGFMLLVTGCAGTYLTSLLCESPGVNCVRVNTKIGMSLDVTGSCDSSGVNQSLSGWTVHFENTDNSSTLSTTTNGSGYGYLALSSGSYNYYWTPPTNPDYWNICEISGSVTINEVDTVIIIDDLAGAVNDNCLQTYVSLSSSRLRPCFTNNTFSIDYGNYGPTIAEDTHVDLFLPPYFEILTTSWPYMIQADGSYRFELGDLGVGSSGRIRLVGEVDCDIEIGTTVCGTAIISPNENACVTPDPLYAGAELRATGTCNGDEIEFRIYNDGNGPSGLVNYQLIEDASLNSINTLNIDAGENELITVAANGSTFRLEVDLPLETPYETQALAIIEGCGNGETSLGFVTALPLLDEDLWIDRYCQETTAAYDPNDKQAIPKGAGSNHLITPNTYLDYKVRFQNTGNDTAFTVIIRDTIETAVFDANSIELGAASHDFFLRQVNDSVFTFNNIQLPDSTIDEPGSHGFVHFSIDQQPDLPDGTRLSNRAGIYFDFNPPIITNESWHIVEKDILSTSVRNFSLEGGPINVYPNPIASSLHFEHDQWPGVMTFELYDQLGRQLIRAELAYAGSQVVLPELRAGSYSYRLIHAQQLAQTGLLIKH